MRPPMIADTSAVSAVFRALSPSPSRRPGAALYDIPAVYLPPTVLLHKVPGPLVMLDFPGQRSLGFTRDGRCVVRDLGVRPLYELHALHLVEGALEGGPIREPTLPPTLGEKLRGSIVIPLRGCRIELLHRLLRGLRRETALLRSCRRAGRGRPALLISARALVLAGPSAGLSI